MRAVSALIFLLTLAPFSAAAEDYTGLFENAVQRVTWQYPENWAFTEKRQGKESVKVGRFDPSKPEGHRWRLLSVDGRNPTEDEAEKYREEKSGERGFLGGDDDNGEEDEGPAAVVRPGSLELVEESDSHWLLGFIPTGDDEDEEKFMRKMAGTVRIAKAGGHLEYLDISSEKPVRPAMGVKIRDFNTRFEFAEAVDGGPIVPVAFRFRIEGRAFLAVGFDEMETLEFSDFEPVSD